MYISSIYLLIFSETEHHETPITQQYAVQYEDFHKALKPTLDQSSLPDCFVALNLAGASADRLRTLKMFLWLFLCHEVVDMPPSSTLTRVRSVYLEAFRNPASPVQDLFSGIDATLRSQEQLLFVALLDQNYPLQQIHEQNKDLANLLSGTADWRAGRGMRHMTWATVAIVLGLPPKQNHLWYALFNPHAMHGTLGIGSYSVVELPINTVHYDCGTVINFDGDWDADKVVARHRLAATNYYVMHFMTYSMFSVGYLVYPGNRAELLGPQFNGHQGILSSYAQKSGLSNFLGSYVQNNCDFMTKLNPSLVYENKTMFFVNAIWSWYQVQSTLVDQDGIFISNSLRHPYEDSLFAASNNTVSKYAEIADFYGKFMKIGDLALLLQRYETRIPVPLTSSTLINDLERISTDWHFLHNYCCNVRRFDFCRLMFVFADFYQSLVQCRVARRLTCEEAEDLKMGAFFAKVAFEDQKEAIRLRALYDLVVDGYHRFKKECNDRIEVVCQDSYMPELGLELTSVLYFLQMGNKDTALYASVTKCMELQNSILDQAHAVADNLHTVFSRIFGEDSSKNSIRLADLRPYHLLKSNPDFARIALGTFTGSLDCVSVAANPAFDFKALQSYAFAKSFLGKRRVVDIDSVFAPFSFKQLQPKNSGSWADAAFSLDKYELPGSFKDPLAPADTNVLLFFHNLTVEGVHNKIRQLNLMARYVRESPALPASMPIPDIVAPVCERYDDREQTIFGEFLDSELKRSLWHRFTCSKLHALLDYFITRYRQQDYMFASLSPVVKSLLPSSERDVIFNALTKDNVTQDKIDKLTALFAELSDVDTLQNYYETRLTEKEEKENQLPWLQRPIVAFWKVVSCY